MSANEKPNKDIFQSNITPPEFCSIVLARIAAAQIALDAAREAKSATEKSIDDLNNTIKQLKEAFNKQESVVYDNQVKISILQNSIARRTKNYNDYDCANKPDDLGCKILSEELERDKKELEEAKAQQKKDQDILDKLKKDINDNQKKLDELNKKLKNDEKNVEQKEGILTAALEGLQDCTNPTARVPSLISECENGYANLIWNKPEHAYFKKFSIEKSEDGLTWQSLQSIEVSDLRSTSVIYSFKDKNPGESGFYRVIAFDGSGRKTYSALVGSPCAKSPISNVSLRPNPIKNVAVFDIPSLKSMQVRLTLYNSQGRLVTIQYVNLHIGSNQLKLDLSNVSNGFYTLTTSWGNDRKSLKVIKE